MKGLSPLLILSLLAGVAAQIAPPTPSVITFVSEDFELGVLPNGWKRSQNANSTGWLVGSTDALASSFFDIPPRTGNVAVDNDDGCGQYCDGAFNFLDTPAFSQDPSLGETFVRFDTYFTGEYGQTASLAYSTTGPTGNYTTWVQLPDSDPETTSWQTFSFNLPFLPANGSISVRFWSSDGGTWAGGWAIDNVLIAQNNWTGVVPQCAPLLSPGNSSGIPVSGGSIAWTGANARFPFGYFVYFGTDFPPTNVANRLDVRRSTTYTPPALTAGATYYFKVVPYGKDRLEAPNCAVYSFVASLPPSVPPTVPYNQDFEVDAGGWFSGGNQSTWAYGTPNKTSIRTGHSGTKLWVNGGLTGNYNNREQSWVRSPDFSFSNVSAQTYVTFWVTSDLESTYDGVKFQYSIDSATWMDLGVFGDTNWYNDYDINGLPPVADGWTGSFGWRQVAHLLPQTLQGQPQVAFRFFFGSDSSITRNGFGFDDFQVDYVPSGPPRCADIRYPSNADTDVATKVVLTWARSPLEHPLLPLGMTVRFGSDNPPTNVISEADVGLSLSIETPDLLPQTTYYWQVVPYGYGGVRAVNCPVWSFSVAQIQATFPYSQDFESGEGGWAPLGNRSSWAFGYPNKTTVIGCGSGSFCWTTGGISGTYSNSENNYVISPVFDFSALQYDPFIVLKVFWEVEKDYDGANVQYQIANGSWVTVGTTIDGTNWYTSSNVRSRPGGSLLGWSGRDGLGSNRWVVATNELVGIAGLSRTRLRISFASDISIVDDGFAFDDVKVVPAPSNVVPDCATVVYPLNGAADVTVPTTLNIRWSVNTTVVGLPRGYFLRYGLTPSVNNSINTGILTNFPLVNVGLTRGTTYYWQVVPYGYNSLLAANCPVWSFTTVAAPTTPTAPTNTPSTARTYTASTATPPTLTSAPVASTTINLPPTSASSARPSVSSQPARSSSPAINGEKSGKKGPSSGAVAAAVIIPLIVFIIIVVVVVVLYVKYARKSHTKEAKLQAAQRELEMKENRA